ncbi:Uncharacterised protein [Mycobacteroides abscessus subsp. abscessus]|nr:Uncharacterised protein [Mycobacteroides abscessus subsp. abscessus]
MANGTSALTVSRIGFPLSHDSATAMASRFASIRSATRLRMSALSAGESLAQPGAAACAASSAFSTSASPERGISQNTSPVTGVRFSKYRPCSGGTHCPPTKFS